MWFTLDFSQRQDGGPSKQKASDGPAIFTTGLASCEDFASSSRVSKTVSGRPIGSASASAHSLGVYQSIVVCMGARLLRKMTLMRAAASRLVARLGSFERMLVLSPFTIPTC